MNYIVVPSKKLIVGWNEKVGCSTMKATILKDLGLGKSEQIEERWHLIMRNAIKNKETPLYDLNYANNNSIDGFAKVCVVRNPYERLISAIRHKFVKAIVDNHNMPEDLIENYIKISELTIEEYIINLQQNNFFPDYAHNKPQTVNLSKDIIFDKVYDINDMDLFISNYFEEQENIRYASNLKVHMTKYNNTTTDYTNMKIKDIIKEESFSSNPSCWFSAESIKIINELYKEDFEFCKKHGIEYKML